jgi:predicted amidohydrolase
MLKATLAQAMCTIFVVALTDLVGARAGYAQQASERRSGLVKVAAMQIKGYDKGNLPREGYDPTEAIVPYIDRASKDSAQLVVFPEYILGHIRVPSPITKKILVAAAANHIYVIIGGWETHADGSLQTRR